MCEEDGYNILLFLDYIKASRFWWLLSDNKNSNFVLNYYVSDTLLSALYVLISSFGLNIMHRPII